MAKRELRKWHYQATTVLAVVTLLLVIAFFAQTFRFFFLTEHDPVLIAVERIKQRADEHVKRKAAEATQPTAQEP